MSPDLARVLGDGCGMAAACCASPYMVLGGATTSAAVEETAMTRRTGQVAAQRGDARWSERGRTTQASGCMHDACTMHP
jgi:hypothetical protein